MFVTVWQYDILPGAETAFEALYGPEGGWVALFRTQAGWISTELLRAEHPGRYLTLDRWRSAEAYNAFLQTQHPSYALLDAQGDALTSSERHLGAFTVAGSR